MNTAAVPSGGGSWWLNSRDVGNDTPTWVPTASHPGSCPSTVSCRYANVAVVSSNVTPLKLLSGDDTTVPGTKSGSSDPVVDAVAWQSLANADAVDSAAAGSAPPYSNMSCKQRVRYWSDAGTPPAEPSSTDEQSMDRPPADGFSTRSHTSTACVWTSDPSAASPSSTSVSVSKYDGA